MLATLDPGLFRPETPHVHACACECAAHTCTCARVHMHCTPSRVYVVVLVWGRCVSTVSAVGVDSGPRAYLKKDPLTEVATVTDALFGPPKRVPEHRQRWLSFFARQSSRALDV
jgi:hypothetical protein